MTTGDELRPWGRFKIVSKDLAEEKDHLYFYKSVNRIGRNPSKVDLVLDMLFVSSIHCIVTLEGTTEKGDPIVKIEDMSRNGIYINEELLGKSKTAVLQPNITIHFTKPGIQVKNVPPTVYKFEILKSGLTSENEARRIKHDRQSTTSRAKGVPVTPTQTMAGKKRNHADGEELQVEATKTLPTGEHDVSPPSKKGRHTMSTSRTEDEDLLSTSAQIQKANQSLRQKLKDAAEREVKSKETLSEKEREIANLNDVLRDAKVQNDKLNQELEQRDVRIADRDRQLERVKLEKEALQQQVEQLQADLASVHAANKRNEETIQVMKDERAKVDIEILSMTSQLEASQTKTRKLEEQVKMLHNENKNLEVSLDSIQTRSEQVEEGKRGAYEETILLKSRLATVQQIFREMGLLVIRGNRSVEDEHSIISQELEELRRHSDQSFLSSEQSQPTPVQDNFCPDTQPEDGDDDVEQTMDQEAALSRAALLTTKTSALELPGRQTPTFPTLSSSVSVDLMGSEQQPVSTDLSVEDTPLFPDAKSLSSESTSSSYGSVSKTPPPPPLQRESLLRAEAKTLLSKEAVDRVPTPKMEKSEEDLDEEVKPSDDLEADGVDEEKENRPSPSLPKQPQSQSQSQQAGQVGWLKSLVNENETAESQQPSASEGGGIFDDETQLSAGE